MPIALQFIYKRNNESVISSTFLSIFKLADIISTRKRKSGLEKSDYGSVSLLPNISKILEVYALADRTLAWLFSCKFAACFQNTFSKGYLWRAASDILVSVLQGPILGPILFNVILCDMFLFQIKNGLLVMLTIKRAILSC